jgi:hypothetical protein
MQPPRVVENDRNRDLPEKSPGHDAKVNAVVDNVQPCRAAGVLLS